MFGFKSEIAKRNVRRLNKSICDLKDNLIEVVSAYDKSVNDKRKLSEALDDLKLKKKIEQEDIEHMVKMKMARNEIEYEKKVASAEAAADKRVADATKGFNDKLTAILKKQIDDGNDRFEQILGRLPDVKVNMGNAADKKDD